MPSLVRTPDLPSSAQFSPVDPAGTSARAADPLAVTTWYVKRVHLRRLLSSRGAQRLVAASTLVLSPRRHLLFDPASAGDSVWWIDDGRARLVCFRSDGREVIAAVLEEGEVFGQEPRTPLAVADAYVEVIESGEFRVVERALFERVLDEEEDAANAIAKQIAHHHGWMDPPEWIGERDPKAPATRLAATLASFLPALDASELPRMSLQEWALLTGLPRPALLEHLATLVDGGVCAVETGIIRLLDRARLTARVNPR